MHACMQADRQQTDRQTDRQTASVTKLIPTVIPQVLTMTEAKDHPHAVAREAYIEINGVTQPVRSSHARSLFFKKASCGDPINVYLPARPPACLPPCLPVCLVRRRHRASLARLVQPHRPRRWASTLRSC